VCYYKHLQDNKLISLLALHCKSTLCDIRQIIMLHNKDITAYLVHLPFSKQTAAQTPSSIITIHDHMTGHMTCVRVYFSL
jgi:hypothetical protein